MTVAYEDIDPGRQDPRYATGMAHMQAGKWQDAVSCFEGLALAYPQSLSVQRALEQARFKAHIQGNGRIKIKGRRWIIPWGTLLVRLAIVVGLVALGYFGTRLVTSRVIPMIARAQEENRLAKLLASGDSYLKAGNLDEAEKSYQQFLVAIPDHPKAVQGLKQIAEQREIAAQYQQGVDLQESGDVQAALTTFEALSARAPGYRDVNARLTALQRHQELEKLFAQAEADFQAGKIADAATEYRKLHEMNVTYRAEEVTNRLYDISMQLGSEYLKGGSSGEAPSVEGLQQALGYFSQALTLRPRSVEAAQEQRLVSTTLSGRARYYEERWEEAISDLRQVYEERPGYLNGIVAEMLYDAYIRSGDKYQAGGDLYLAFDQFVKANALTVADKSLSIGRMAALKPLLTPTATPTNTLTPTPTPTPTETPQPTNEAPAPATGGRPVYDRSTRTPTPTMTPSIMPLAAYRNRILFISANPQQPGLWAMDVNGNNRVFVGSIDLFAEAYKQALEKTQLSPDGNWRLVVQGAKNDKTQIFIVREGTGGSQRQLTNLSKLSYDPVWSPDGQRVAFVSQTTGRDEIWVINPDGSGGKMLSENKSFDKHPSWSPDSQRIVFWSNRTGKKQIFVMDANGRNAHNISNTDWDEYDPLWLR